MENTESVYEQLVKQSLKGSRRINEMRKEIDAIVGMVLGFLDKNDESRFKNGEDLELFSVDGFWWRLEKRKGTLDIYITSHYKGKLVYILGWGNHLLLEDVRPIRRCLPDFLKSMIFLFPRLKEKFTLLLKAIDVELPNVGEESEE